MNNPWLVCTRPRPEARLRLFCVPFAGGAASVFHAWGDRLPQLVEVFAVQLPGREGRLAEPPISSLSSVVDALADALRPHLDLPFALFGHSMGAFICFEFARRLRREKERGPVYLFASGCRAPHLPDPDPPIHHLPDPEFIEGLRQFDGTPEAVLQHEELMQLFLPILRADLAIHETYEYTQDEPLDCPISAFGGAEDAEVSREEIEAWREHTRGGFRLRTFSGNHFFLQSSRIPLLQALSQDLIQILSRMGGVAGW